MERRQRRTIESMVKLYCHAHHGAAPGFCAECQELLDYALTRMVRCPFTPKKPTSDRCTIHCYAPTQRERVRQVMRYAGPRMLLRHPLLALGHLWDRAMSERRMAARQGGADR